MSYKNFVFRGKKLSDLGLMLCDFSGSNSLNTRTLSSYGIETIKNNLSNKFMLSHITEDSPLVKTFSICKIVCDNQSLFFTDEDISNILDWLQIDVYSDLSLLDDDGSVSISYTGLFDTFSAFEQSGNIVGLQLQFTSAHPFGFAPEISHNITLNSTSNIYELKYLSDRYGEYPPTSLEIKCLQNGDLSINNSLVNRKLIVKNCKQNEIIKLDCENCIITSSDANHNEKLYNDFNFVFFTLNKTLDTNINVISSSLPCSMSLKYKPIRKMGLIR